MRDSALRQITPARKAVSALPQLLQQGETVTSMNAGSPIPIGEAGGHRSRIFAALAASSFSLLLAALPAPQSALALDDPARSPLPATPPLPPPRPHYPAETDAVPAIPQAAEPAPAAEAPRQTRSLPPASRARMHACGLEWQKMKAAGSAADKTWYEFAAVCLVR